jgi:hypothetical protein
MRILLPVRIALTGLAATMALTALASAIALASLPAALAAFKEGPLPNMTGGFDDPTCHTCHLDNPENAPGGTLSIAGIPAAYDAGRTYPVTVRLQREDMRRGGFEIGARFASGQEKARQAGTWRVLDARVQIQRSRDGTLQFAQHTSAGTLAATRGDLRWTIEWTAPAERGAPVQFNVAANASNDDASPLGDYIYLQERRSMPKTGRR